jgi:N-acetylglucosamine kinase-like BadF-type ATPase
MTQWVLGVDGGGTKTLAAICDSSGHVLGVGRGGASNIDDVGLEQASTNIQQAVAAARKQANLEMRPFDAAFLGLAGIVSERDRELARGLATKLELAAPERLGVDHDCRIALAGGLSGRAGIVLIVGTGSSCFGINANGDSWRAGGWGSLISDEGSAYFLGRESLIASVRALDGRGPNTELAAIMLEQLGVLQPDDLLHRIYVTGLNRSEIAALAPLVLEVANDGDLVALEILERGSRMLAECVKAVAKHLQLEHQTFEVVAVGGLYNASKLVQQKLRQQILEFLPDAQITPPELSPVLGACLLALELLGKLTPATLKNLKLENAKLERDKI